MFKFLRVFNVMGKALTDKLSCPVTGLVWIIFTIYEKMYCEYSLDSNEYSHNMF